MKKTADVIIIGGGINGCATAYYLAKRGIKDVLVLEADDSIGHGGSSRNGGGVRQSGRDVRELPYAMYAVNNMWPTLSEELGVDVEYYQRGNLRLGKTEAHLKKLETLASNARSVGLDMHVIDGIRHKLHLYLSRRVHRHFRAVLLRAAAAVDGADEACDVHTDHRRGDQYHSGPDPDFRPARFSAHGGCRRGACHGHRSDCRGDSGNLDEPQI